MYVTYKITAHNVLKDNTDCYTYKLEAERIEFNVAYEDIRNFLIEDLQAAGFLQKGDSNIDHAMEYRGEFFDYNDSFYWVKYMENPSIGVIIYTQRFQLPFVPDYNYAYIKTTPFMYYGIKAPSEMCGYEKSEKDVLWTIEELASIKHEVRKVSKNIYQLEDGCYYIIINQVGKEIYIEDERIVIW